MKAGTGLREASELRAAMVSHSLLADERAMMQSAATLGGCGKRSRDGLFLLSPANRNAITVFLNS